MNISYRWLKELAPDLNGSASELAERLTYTAVPVDSVVWLGSQLEQLVVARVESIARHPRADRLVICQVDAGRGDPVQVVTGAPVVVERGYYPFVGVGQQLPGGTVIKRAKLRGEYSEGMLCSEKELGIGRDASGIMLLNGEYTPGQPLLEALDLDDHRLEVDVTANRPDLLGHWGVARELAPGGDESLRSPDFPGQVRAGYAVDTVEREGSTAGVTVRIEDLGGCPRYMGAVIRGVQIGPSPQWLANRLYAIGQQPINNVVDATNYVLHELNQPIHAFDLSTLRGPAVVVRRAEAGELLRTLDGKNRTLSREMLVIADAEVPTAMAGLMGGEATEVTERTRDLFIECAYFDPKRVRRAAKALGLDTDASYRFQRGVDPCGLPKALKRVVELILTTAGGAVDGSAIDVNPIRANRRNVKLRPDRVGQVLGEALDRQSIRGCLEPIGFEITEREDGALTVSVPTWRPDVEREVDLIEEVARRYGYDRFSDEMGVLRPTTVPEEGYVDVMRRIRGCLVTAGLLEARTSPFVNQSEGAVRILNPLSEREDHLRADLISGLVHRIEYNLARGVRDVRLFEIGTVFADSSGPTPREEIRVAFAWTGQRAPAHWSEDSREFDVWDLKTLFTDLASLASPQAQVTPAEADSVASLEQPFLLIGEDGQSLGWAGRVPADRVEAPRWAAPVWGAELVVCPARVLPVAFRPLPIYPAVERDVALIVPVTTLAEEIRAVIVESGPDWLEDVSAFDVYQGENIPEGARSIAWRLRFRSADRTLTDKEVDAAMGRIISALQEKRNVGIRGA